MSQSQAWGLSEPRRELVLYSCLMHFIVVNSSSSQSLENVYCAQFSFPQTHHIGIVLFIHTLPSLSGFSGTHARPTDLHA